jgi:hypothetical protein
MGRFVLRCLFLLFVTGLVVAGLVCYRTQQAAVAARQYVSDVFRLQIGKSGAGDFARIREKYRGYEYRFEGEQACSNEDCDAAFWFPKGGPGRAINVVHPRFLYSILTLSHGSIAAASIHAVCYHGGGPPFDVNVLEHVASPYFPGPYQEYRHLSLPKVSWIRFELTPAASAEQRSRAYALNLAYMGQFGTCHDATDLHEPDQPQKR